MTEIIEALEPVDGKATVRVHIGDAVMEIGREAAATLGLAPGLAVTAGLRQAIDAAADRRAAAARALHHLRGRPRTVHEVRAYLGRHGHGAASVDAVLAELQAKGLVDDARYAAWFVQSKQGRRPAGTGRIARELAARGVARELAASAIQLAGAGSEAELERALSAARPRLESAIRLGRERGMRRLHGFLMRRGFGSGVAREACLRLFAAVPSEPRAPTKPRGDVSPWSEPPTRSAPPI